VKTLLVMRHAESDGGASFGSDHERPLAGRGIEAARRMGRFVTASGTVPELVLSSTAVRALTTIELAAERVLEVIGEIDNVVDRLLIAGHEPTWSSLVTWLIGGGTVRMPTAAVACLDLPHGDWIDLAPATCDLRWFVTPEMLKGK
jgi:phosphohistidine phosphatase